MKLKAAIFFMLVPILSAYWPKAHSIPFDETMHGHRRGRAVWIKKDIHLVIKSSLFPFAHEFTEEQRLSALANLAQEHPTEDINEGVILALGHALAAYSGGADSSQVIKAMLELLYTKGDISHINAFRNATVDFQTLHREEFRKEIAPLIQRTEEAMRSRVFRLERLAYYERGLERSQVDQMYSFAKATLAAVDGRPDNVVSLQSCRKILEPSDQSKDD